MSASLLIRNGRLLLPDGARVDAPLLVRGGRIAVLGEPDPSAETLDAAGCTVAPGLIDIHTHGLRDESAIGSLPRLAALEAACGATTFFPTLFGPPDETIAHLERHLAETDGLRAVPGVGGFRLESPYLADPSGGLPRDVAPISPALTERLWRAGQGHIRLWDVSPELPGAAETIAGLSDRGVVCSLAHTNASIAQARAAVDAGARLVTHLFDVFPVPPVTDPGVYPAGLVDYLLLEDRLACEIIPDGTHVPPLLVEKAFRCKPPDKLVFITDGNYGAGLPPGDYDLPQAWGRVRITGPYDGLRLLDRGLELAASALSPLDAFRAALQRLGKDWAAASRVCSRNPARLLGLNKGELAVGRDADLILLDDGLDLAATLVGGRVVYRRGA